MRHPRFWISHSAHGFQSCSQKASYLYLYPFIIIGPGWPSRCNFNPMEPIITIRSLSKHYGDKQVLRDISLDIYPGQIIGYIGPNGAGKSTTVKILTGIITDYEGEVMIDGKLLRDNILGIKGITGYVPELAELYDLLTPSEYLTFIGKLHHLPDELIRERS